MRSRIAFLVFVSLLLTGAPSGFAQAPAAGGPMSPATVAPTLVPNPAQAPCSGNASPAGGANFAPDPDPRVQIPQGCGPCGTCTNPRTMCWVFNQGWGTCNRTMEFCGEGGGWRCECDSWGGQQ